MLRLRDLHTHEEHFRLEVGNTLYGHLIARYEVQKYTDVRNLGEKTGYIVTCTQRVRIPNRNNTGDDLPAAPDPGECDPYPALLWSQTVLEPLNSEASPYSLASYSPKTLNSSITASRSTSNTADASFQLEHTSGSSQSQSNTFGVSASAGFMGEMPTGGVEVSYQHGESSERHESTTAGSTTRFGAEMSDSVSMSVKDWGCIAAVDAARQAPSWTWSQEYPWNVSQFRSVDSNRRVILPSFVRDRLLQKDKTGNITLSPPSEIAQFGVDVASRCSWIVFPDPTVPMSDTIKISHKIILAEASHVLEGNKDLRAKVDYRNDIPVMTSDLLDLGRLALDPISETRPLDAAFNMSGDSFRIPPGGNNEFLAVSRSNKLLIAGAGFTRDMCADFAKEPAFLRIDFKVWEEHDQLTLFLKHWKLAGGRVRAESRREFQRSARYHQACRLH